MIINMYNTILIQRFIFHFNTRRVNNISSFILNFTVSCTRLNVFFIRSSIMKTGIFWTSVIYILDVGSAFANVSNVHAFSPLMLSLYSSLCVSLAFNLNITPSCLSQPNLNPFTTLFFGGRVIHPASPFMQGLHISTL